VVTPDAEQLALAFASLAVEVFDPADDQTGGDRLALLRGERGVSGLGGSISKRPKACHGLIELPVAGEPRG
jgi:hypothetical protein